MDIARTPATPDGNPKMADAAPQPKEPPLIRREDYRPFPWLVPQVSLDFRLGLGKTRVKAALTVHRNAKAEPSQMLRLNGDELTPLEVLVDGEAINSWSMDGSDLMVPLHHEDLHAAACAIAQQQHGGRRAQRLGRIACRRITHFRFARLSVRATRDNR